MRPFLLRTRQPTPDPSPATGFQARDRRGGTGVGGGLSRPHLGLAAEATRPNKDPCFGGTLLPNHTKSIIRLDGQYGLVWLGMVWYGLVWPGIVW